LYSYLYDNSDAASAYYKVQLYGFDRRGISLTEDRQNAALASWANQDVLKNYFAGDIITDAVELVIGIDGVGGKTPRPEGAGSSSVMKPVFQIPFWSGVIDGVEISFNIKYLK
jgi:hypothetical protein